MLHSCQDINQTKYFFCLNLRFGYPKNSFGKETYIQKMILMDLHQANEFAHIDKRLVSFETKKLTNNQCS